MKRMVLGIMGAVVMVGMFAYTVLAADATAVQERTQAFELVKGFFSASWPVLAAWLVSEIMPFLPTKANGLAHLVYTWLKSRAGGGMIGIILIGVMLGGCVTINNSALSGEKNAVKTDADAQQTISPNTTANIPLK